MNVLKIYKFLLFIERIEEYSEKYSREFVKEACDTLICLGRRERNKTSY